jgi:hypothetical protein
VAASRGTINFVLTDMANPLVRKHINQQKPPSRAIDCGDMSAFGCLVVLWTVRSISGRV